MFLFHNTHINYAKVLRFTKVHLSAVRKPYLNRLIYFAYFPHGSYYNALMIQMLSYKRLSVCNKSFKLNSENFIVTNALSRSIA